MYKMQLYKTAILSSPIMGAFELSPIFLLVKQPYPDFWLGLLFLSTLTFIIWLLNIYVIHIQESRKTKTVERYILSYLFSLLFCAFLWIISHFVLPNDNHQEKPSPFFPIINIITLNTIILIISNAIIARSKKEQTEKELADLRIKHLEAEQQQLIQQMQPHFLFNALSTLNSIISTDADLAKKYLVKLSNFLRFTVSAHENAIIPLTEELKFTQDYIDLQQMRFEDSFFCTISIPEEKTGRYNIPVYALQSLVENAIKHNLFNEERPLKLSIVLQDDSLIISNNKMTKTKSIENANEGVGLKNLKKRYLLSSGSDIVISETSQDFTVVLKLISKAYD
jgi:two-component system, LytTR family, sensor kinase